MSCQVLATPDHDTLILSSYSVASTANVQVGCRQFARRLTSGAGNLTCVGTSWQPSTTTFKCEFNGHLNTYEKVIIGSASAGGGVLFFGFVLICCLAAIYKDKRENKTDFDSYPPSAINEKVGNAQYGNGYGYGNGAGDGVGDIRGYRPSGKYEKQIPSDQRNEQMKHDPILWSNSNRRETERTEQTNGYHFYTGKNFSAQYDNKAFDRNEYDRGSGYRNSGYHGTNYVQGKREDYRWNGQLPRPHMQREDRYNRPL